MLEWAKKEIELACKRENPNRKEGEFDYGCSCYESALKAFESLLGDNHSGMSIGFTKNILNRLIDGKCLTPIEDTDDIWNHVHDNEDGTKHYQCTRMSSLFKKVSSDGAVKYNDVNRTVMIDIPTGISWHSGLVDRIVDELSPITMPYFPREKRYEIYCEDFLTDPKNGDYDTVGIFYGIDPDGNRFEINRYFKDADIGMDEIDREEYEARKLMDLKRKGIGE